MTTNRTRRNYNSEFKKDALKHLELSGKSVTEVASDLGVKRDRLYKWRIEAQERGDVAFPGKGRQGLTEAEAEVLKLKKQLKNAQEERDILKKAVAIFSKASK
jgi:transposase